MKNALTIKRRNAEQSEYQQLRKQGISWIQELAGTRWTDYNVHDPGVTILEQLCFALTDISYRTHFDIEDYLTDASGDVNAKRLALHPPTEVLPARPTTTDDLRRAILDEVPEIANVWVTSAEGDIGGLYQIEVILNEETPTEKRAEIGTKVADVYHGVRNLGEDLAGVTFVKDIPCILFSDVEISCTRSPAAIAAEIYAKAAAWMCPAVHPRRYPKEMSPDALLEGPLLRRGYIEDAALAKQHRELYISDLVTGIRDIEGVAAVIEIAVAKADAPEACYRGIVPNGHSGAVLRLHMPSNDEEIRVRLYRNGKQIPVGHRDMEPQFEKYRHQQKRSDSPGNRLDKLDAPPLGEHRNLLRYRSIQHLFPATYSIGPMGLPSSATPAERGRSSQLQAYLLLFDQLMANYLAGYHQISTLFSLDVEEKATYGSRALKRRAVPGVDRLWLTDNIKETEKTVARIVADHDDFVDRKGRLLDYLLALHGETFTQRSLRHFNYYDAPGTADDAVIQNKIRMLRNIAELNRDRAAGYDMRGEKQQSPGSPNISGLRRKASVILDISIDHWGMTDVYANRRFRIITDKKFESEQQGKPFFAPVKLMLPLKRSEGRLYNMPWREIAQSERTALQRVSHHFTLPRGLGESVVREGVFLDRYHLHVLPRDHGVRLLLKVPPTASPGQDRWWHLSTFIDAESAALFGNVLRNTFVLLNRCSEGFHVVEHLLLRPMSGRDPDNVQPDFYKYKISIVLPSWTARFHHSQFRRLIGETVDNLCPAHLHPLFLWMDFNQMAVFEKTYLKWRILKTLPKPGKRRLDALSRRLKEMLTPATPSRG